jgi:hypothetical protein
VRSEAIDDDLFVALEQLETIRDLLRTNSPVKARMALILLDSLADAVLFRRLERIYDASEEPLLRHLMPQYSNRERSVARQRFNKRVEIARRLSEVDRWRGESDSLIDDADAAVLKVGHSYRNDAYHEDSHNEDVVASIARVLFAAVARLITRLQPRGVSFGGLPPADIDRLAEWGYEDGSSFELRELADAVASNFIAELALDVDNFRDLLAKDLESRVESLRADVEFLGQSSIDPATIIQGVELWSHYGADEQLLELAQQFDPFVMSGELESGRPPDEVFAQREGAMVSYRRRMNELERDHKRRVSLDLMGQGTRVAARLRRLNDPSQILVAYWKVDAPLGMLEQYVHQAVMALDREIERQSDIERGK